MRLQALGGRSTLLPYCSVRLKTDDVLFMRFGSGGGYGDPLDRDPRAVANDVINGLVSTAAAASVYGVEVSTAGLRKPVGALYPDPAFLEMCLEAGCPVALSSDAHVPDQRGGRRDPRRRAHLRLMTLKREQWHPPIMPDPACSSLAGQEPRARSG